ncbi:class I SAM-dependent methyltransferase [uncultured Tistrella sp.]|uniref:methyltransferase domain-containing protein n=1 Tax=Tistrella mobilis TaxID=171437 RepID=UPI0026231A1D|nr:class I SAM-dependent methyltransferase [uncultured Tistrella sp.]
MSGRERRFDRLYACDPDPWGFRDRPYEREKYRASLAALPARRWRVAIEAGCSIGELTRLLSATADRVIGIDVSGVALEIAARRCADRPNVAFLRAELPEGWPALAADLIILSEVLYFLSAAEIDRLAARIAGLWPADGYCLLVNWLGPTGEALQGEEAARLFLARLAAHAGPLDHTIGGGTGYRIDLASRAKGISRERSPCGDSAGIPDAAGDRGYPAPPGAGRDG